MEDNKMAKLTTAEFIDAIKELSVLELNDLVKACEEEFGVSAAAGVVVAAAGGDAPAAERGGCPETAGAGDCAAKDRKPLAADSGCAGLRAGCDPAGRYAGPADCLASRHPDPQNLSGFRALYSAAGAACAGVCGFSGEGRRGNLPGAAGVRDVHRI